MGIGGDDLTRSLKVMANSTRNDGSFYNRRPKHPLSFHKFTLTGKFIVVAYLIGPFGIEVYTIYQCSPRVFSTQIA